MLKLDDFKNYRKQNIREELEVENNYMNIKELAKYLNVKQSTIYNWINNKRIPALRVVGSWRFRRSEIERWIKNNNSMPLEKRIFNRTIINTPAQIGLLNPSLNVPSRLSARSLNVSKTGACVELENSILPKQISVNLILDLTRLCKAKVETICKVIWNKPSYRDGKFKCGLQFTKVETDQKNIIKKIM